MRLAFARGEASSEGARRKIGHIRASGDCVRQRPQPLQPPAVCDMVPSQTRCNSSDLVLPGGAGGLPSGGGLPLGGECGVEPLVENERRFFVTGCGLSAMTLPGLSRL